jgi:hypothetical protein
MPGPGSVPGLALIRHPEIVKAPESGTAGGGAVLCSHRDQPAPVNGLFIKIEHVRMDQRVGVSKNAV